MIPQIQNPTMLMLSSKRIEKQIKGIQDKAEGVKTEVCGFWYINIVKTPLSS
jgi:hypothetical protein